MADVIVARVARRVVEAKTHAGVSRDLRTASADCIDQQRHHEDQLASWLIIALHTWISIRWAGFPIALGAGIGGTFFALFAASAKLGKYYSWLLPMNVFVDGRFRMALILGAGGGIIAALVACAELARRDVT